MTFTDIVLTKAHGTATITINRPQVLNAFRSQTVDEMIAALEDAGTDPTIGVLVITGAGDRAFCVSSDVKEFRPGGYAGASWTGIGIKVETLHRLIRTTPKPVIAAVNGYAIGGGNVLQVVCDLSMAGFDTGGKVKKVYSKDSFLGQPFALLKSQMLLLLLW